LTGTNQAARPSAIAVRVTGAGIVTGIGWNWLTRAGAWVCRFPIAGVRRVNFILMGI